MAKRTPEADLKNKVMDAMVHVGGIHAMRMNAGAVFMGGRWITLGEKGTPDILVMLPNRQVCWLELKSEKGKESDNQKAWRASAERIGHIIYVIRDVDDAVAVVTMARDEANMLQVTNGTDPRDQ